MRSRDVSMPRIQCLTVRLQRVAFPAFLRTYLANLSRKRDIQGNYVHLAMCVIK